MKRFHVHIAVDDVAANVEFYSKLFGQAPAKERPDYAKWILEDPRVNFAISSQRAATGLNHLGMQAETDEELAALRFLARSAGTGELRDEGSVACCYARSDKHWTVDPQGIAWEHFMTKGDADGLMTRSDDGTGCCTPLHRGTGEAAAGAACCVPDESAAVACCA